MLFNKINDIANDIYLINLATIILRSSTYENKIIKNVETGLNNLSAYISLIDKYVDDLSIDYLCTAKNMIDISETFGSEINLEQKEYERLFDDYYKNSDCFMREIDKFLRGINYCPTSTESFSDANTETNANTNNANENANSSDCPPCGDAEIRAASNKMKGISENKLGAKELLKEALLKKHDEEIIMWNNIRASKRLYSLNPLEQEKIVRWYKWKVQDSQNRLDEIDNEIENIERMISNYTRQEDEQRRIIITVLMNCIGA